MRTSNAKHTSSDDEGVVAIEFVLVAPFLIALLLTIASFGSFFSKKVEVTSAARDAARTLALRGTPSYPAGMSAVPGSVVTCIAGDTTSNASVTVTLTGGYDFPSFGPISLGNKPITAIGTMRCGG